MFENAALRQIFGLRTVRHYNSAGCYKEDRVVCAGQDSAVSDIAVRYALRLLVDGQLRDREFGAGRETGRW